ncbi:DUF6318 family protein [Paenarthrobacter histidinolovorans]|uniref:DUF6318 domain-containing protein n=1 Tax=Paenarthrobacter histidinolovorans TaxID=43664 RepID=A0ABW8NBA0_9MICC
MPRLSSAFSFLHARTLGVLVGLAVLLTGCQGGSPTAGTSEPQTTTASPTSSVSVPAASAAPASSGAYKPADAKGKAQNVPVPVMPELAKENSKAGLEAFIGYWYAQLSYVGETGDMSSWLPLIAPECRLCTRLQESGKQSYTDGRWLAGGKISVPAIEVQWKGGSVEAAKVQVVQDQIDYFNADGSVGRSKSNASNDAFAFFAKHADGKWIVVDLGIIT